MRHFFCDSLKRFFVACALTVVGIFSATAANLPTGYTELEYIGLTGTQYIDTGLYGDLNTEAEIDVHLNETTSNANNRIFGNFTNTAKAITINGSNSDANFSRFGDKSQQANIYSSERSVYKINKTNLTRNGVVLMTFDTTTPFTTEGTLSVGSSTSAGGGMVGKLYSAIIRENGNTIMRLVPAKNSSNVIGMYDTVNDVFYTNRGTGTFTAGPATCRNLLDISSATLGYLLNVSGQPNNNVNYYTTDYVNLDFSGDFIVSFTKTAQQNGTTGNIICFYDSNKTFLNCSGQTSAYNDPSVSYWTYTGAVPNNAAYYRYSYRKTDIEMQLELGSIATAYVPHCTTDTIKIATTKYTEDAFAGLMTTLSEAITKVTNIVDTTVQQATEIGNLATTKQDRPDTDCPAGRKCLLIMGVDNKPHWYLIQE